MQEVIGTAADVLERFQQQLDADGVMVGVSRQALNEVLADYRAQAAKLERVRELRDYWRAQSTDQTLTVEARLRYRLRANDLDAILEGDSE